MPWWATRRYTFLAMLVGKIFVEGHMMTPHRLSKTGKPSHKHLSLHISLLVPCACPSFRCFL